jgi:hypothetical protein
LLTVTLYPSGLKEEDDGGRDAATRDLPRERLKSMREVALRLLGQEIDGRPLLRDEFGGEASLTEKE